jgi:hypothetical protein
MITYISNIIPRIQNYSKKLDQLTKLKNKNWVLISENPKEKKVFIFRDNSQLVIANNGKVSIEKWDYVGENQIILSINNQNYLFKHGFLDSTVLALKLDSQQKYAFFINEHKLNLELNSAKKIEQFLIDKYLKGSNDNLITVSDEYHLTKIKTINKIFSKIEVFHIYFKKGYEGKIYVDSKNKLFYFKDYKNFTSELKRYYATSQHLIEAYYLYLSTSRISNVGYIKTMT